VNPKTTGAIRQFKEIPMNRPNASGTILTFLAGLGVGVAAALLLAPKSGEELRSEITERINDEVDNLRGVVRGARRNLKRHADKLVSMAKDEIQEVMDSGDEAYTEAKNA
jgi:gas vesicle protein